MQLHPTCRVLDSTKIKQYMECPRRFFFRYVLGWDVDLPNHHLAYGTCLHRGLATLMCNGLNDDGLASAIAVFQDEYKKLYPNFIDLEEEHAPKNLSNGVRLLYRYVQNYQFRDHFDVLHVEVAGSVPVSEEPPRELYFRLDTVCSENGKVFSLEHKPTSYMPSSWAEQWQLDVQIFAYIHALHYHFHEEAPVSGVVVNGMTICNPPKMKKDGELYANSRDIEFVRVTVDKSYDMLESWLWDLNEAIDDLEWDFECLANCKEGDDRLECFPRRSTHCVNKYGTCPFLALCSAWPNPLQRCAEPPTGFRVEWWDPRDVLKEAKETWKGEN